MNLANSNIFFQNESKFKYRHTYSTIRVKIPPYNPNISLTKCDEVGTIIPNTERLLGRYICSQYCGYGDGGTRYDYFLDYKNNLITNILDYDGTTRYIQLFDLESRINYIKLSEGINTSLSHIIKFLFDDFIIKEICTYL